MVERLLFKIKACMKTIHYVPPLVALIIAAAWLTNLRGSNNTLELDNALLRERLASPGKSSFSQNDGTDARLKSVRAKRERNTPDSVSNPSGDWVSTSRDWTQLVLFNNDEARYQYTGAFKRLETLASEMSGEELTRAYVDMAALPVHAPFRNELESLMLKELERKNPEFAFTQYIERNQDGGTVLGGYGRFDQWLARDPAAATNWYERQIAEGTFDKSLDGNSPAMVPFESAFIMPLIASDPTAAEERMRNIPPDLRAELGPYMWGVSKENGQAFIDMLRRTMPMEEYVDILRNNSLTERNFGIDIGDDPKSAQANLESLGITPEERSTLLAQQFTELARYRAMRDTGNTPSREKFDDYRKWIEEIDPAAADRATGVALQSYIEKSKTADALDFIEKIATDYHVSGAGDELLIPLIEGSANGSAFPKDRARELATKISDAGLRNELLQKLN
jgi:hypothetical protein